MSIERSSYHDPAAFGAEMEALFQKRIFAGALDDFAAEGTFSSIRIGTKAITVRRTNAGIRAFGNVCLHRNALIDPPGRGKRDFRCAYHGWAYGADGKLASAPLSDPACTPARGLPTFPLSEVEGLLFLGAGGISPLTNEIPALLRKTGISLDSFFHRESMDHACNWKLLVENVLEGYHLSFVHPDTFRPAGFTSTADYYWEGGSHTSWSTLEPRGPSNRTQVFRRVSPEAGHYYRHGYVFPDLFLSNTNGMVGFLSHLIPVDASHTRLDWMLFELPALKALAAPLRRHIQSEAIEFSRTALREDQVLVESCQLGVASEGLSMQLQTSEGRITHFHQMYHDGMNHVRE